MFYQFQEYSKKTESVPINFVHRDCKFMKYLYYCHNNNISVDETKLSILMADSIDTSKCTVADVVKAIGDYLGDSWQDQAWHIDIKVTKLS